MLFRLDKFGINKGTCLILREKITSQTKSRSKKGREVISLYSLKKINI